MAPMDRKYVAFVLYPGVTALDVVGSMETLIGLSIGSRYRVVAVGESIDPIQTDTSLRLIPNRAFWEIPSPAVLIVPGGGEAALENDALRRYVQEAGEIADLVASIGTGSLILAKAGLLEGRRATTHWAHAEELEQAGARYVRQRWVEDGKFITAAGVTAGIDMSLHLVSQLRGTSTAKRTQLAIEYDPHPPFGGIDWESVGRVGDSAGRETDRLVDETPQIHQTDAEVASKEQS